MSSLCVSEASVPTATSCTGKQSASVTRPENVTTITLAGHGGVPLVADRYGDVGAPPVIFLHGGGQTRHAWAGAAASLARAGYCAWAVDCRGHGDSGWAVDGDYGLDAMIGDLCHVVAATGGQPAIVGASMGGLTAMVALGEGKVPAASRLVLVDIAPRMEAAGVARILTFMSAHPDGFASLDDARDAIAAYNPHRPPPRDTVGLHKNLRQGSDGRYRWHWDPRFLDHAPHPTGTTESVLLERRLTAARAIRIPVLMVRAAHSDVVSEAGLQELLTLIPHARAVNIADASHMVAGDRNDVFAGAVLDFLPPVHCVPDMDAGGQVPKAAMP